MAAAFDEKSYLEQNPDVAAAVARGEITAADHWEQFGRKEGRKGAYRATPMAPFDAEAYLKENPDVAAAVARGETTAEEHFVKYGQNEGRALRVIGTDVKTNPADETPPKKPLSADIALGIQRYADVPDATDLTPGSLADRLNREVITPYRDMMRRLRDGTMTEEQFRTEGAPLGQRRIDLLSNAAPGDFNEAIRYAGKVTPDFLEEVARNGAAAIDRQSRAGTASATALSAPTQPTTDLQAGVETALERARVRQRRGRGAMMLTGATGLDAGNASVARRLLMGAAA